MEQFGDYLRNVRKSKMTQRELARQVRVGYPYISKLENNIESTPSDELLIKIAGVLNISIDELFIKATRLPPDFKNFIINEPEIFKFIRFLQDNDHLLGEFKNLIKDKEHNYRVFFNQSNEVMLIIDPNTGGIIDANDCAIEFYQYTLDKLKQMNITDINILPKEEIFEEMRKVKLESRKNFHFKHKIGSGDIKEIEVYSRPIIIGGKVYLNSRVQQVHLSSV
ncbi:XRE family transcriptional regulator [Sporanaerobium hydrogeniformans]|uniref:XRE family transcriptional regulator n=1 Tax=Sporanaerobium hydrogeniformans TaxID=3072179 RepID=A0AC61DE46_9FIRM|nr:helix-turn-helix domain-containing protein [Sporanaerobium hydrogeniformans]PHV71431.1 XRE family transcriptional regulator [Sporanaerobium hydrogeniformans]